MPTGFAIVAILTFVRLICFSLCLIFVIMAAAPDEP